MVKIVFDNEFKKQFVRIKDNATNSKLLKQIKKIGENPELGKPMRYARKGTRELYVAPMRLSYTYHKDTDTIELLALYHKDEQ